MKNRYMMKSGRAKKCTLRHKSAEGKELAVEGRKAGSDRAAKVG